MESIDINKILKADVELVAYDSITGKEKRRVKGQNRITRRGVLEMALSFLNAQRSHTSTGSIASFGNAELSSSLNVLFPKTALPENSGIHSGQTRRNLYLLGDATPEESSLTTYLFADKKIAHPTHEYRNSGSDLWDKDTCKFTMSWAYGAADWSGTVRSIIIGISHSEDGKSYTSTSLTSPIDACHRVVLATPFEKLASENAVLNWTWTINLPS